MDHPGPPRTTATGAVAGRNVADGAKRFAGEKIRFLALVPGGGPSFAALIAQQGPAEQDRWAWQLHWPASGVETWSPTLAERAALLIPPSSTGAGILSTAAKVPAARMAWVTT
ncbi:hypothetical protein KRM28CT15_44640 [Krasilnikovia sp. M28-CT-15]